MKKTILLTLLGIATFAFAKPAAAQKFAHINSSELLQMMPEVKTANKQLEEYSKQLRSQLENMTAELNKKYEVYTKEAEQLPAAIREVREKEIQQLQERIETFKETAQESVQNKEKELLEPIVKKAKDAVQAVAKEMGYSYVFDTSTGSLIMFPDSDNLMGAVKKKLGIVEEKAPAPGTTKPATPAAPAK